MNYKDMFPVNDEWWNPRWISKSVVNRSTFVEFPAKFFHDHNEDTRRAMCLYLKWCHENGHKPKYMNANAVKILCETFPYIVTFDNGYKHLSKMARRVFHCPRDPEHEELFPRTTNGGGDYNFNTILTPQVLRHWLSEATEWEKSLAVDEVNGPGDVRDAMYRVSTALTSGIASQDSSIILYVSGWIDEIKRTLDQYATTHDSARGSETLD